MSYKKVSMESTVVTYCFLSEDMPVELLSSYTETHKKNIEILRNCDKIGKFKCQFLLL